MIKIVCECGHGIDAHNDRCYSIKARRDLMDFWWGLVIGLFCGANIGLLVIGLCLAAQKGDRMSHYGNGLNDGDNRDQKY